MGSDEVKVIRSPLFTDEELSLVFDAHTSDRMARRGFCEEHSKVCVLQAVYGVDQDNDGDYLISGFVDGTHTNIIWWFDNYYDYRWTADEFLAQLEAQGLA